MTTDITFTPDEDTEVDFTPEEEPTSLCGCTAIRITPHIFVAGLCDQEDDEDSEDE